MKNRDRDRGGLLDFLKNQDRDRGGLSQNSGRVRGHRDFSQEESRQVGIIRGVGGNRDNLNFSRILKLSRLFFVGISRDVEISRDFRSPNDLENRAKSREKSRKLGEIEIISTSPNFSTFPDLSRVVSMNLEKKFLHPDQLGRSGVPDLDNLDASG